MYGRRKGGVLVLAFAAALLMLAFATVSASEEAEADDNDIGGGLAYELNITNKTLKIKVKDSSGSMVMDDFDTEANKAPWIGTHPNNMTKLIIEDGVKHIGNYAFYNCTGLTGDESGNSPIPGSVESIGEGAFKGCTGLACDLVIPDSVKAIGGEAFAGCSSLSGSPRIPAGVSTIGASAFEGCSTFSGLVFADGSILTSIGAKSFSGCTGFRGNLTIPSTVTSIGNNAFSGCGFNGNLSIPNTISSIAEGAFSGCSAFTGELIIPASVTSIGASAFEGCSTFNKLTFGTTNLNSIGNKAFYGCQGFLDGLTIPGTVTSIGVEAFRGCSGFSGDSEVNLVLPDNLTEIPEGAFRGCSGFIGKLVIPKTVTALGKDAFSGCSSFNMLEFPSNSDLTEIGEYAFNKCEGFSGTLTIPSKVTKIGSNAFRDCKAFTGELTIHASIATLESYAFYGCKGFEALKFESGSLGTIGGNAFNGCTGFSGTLEIPNKILKIGGSAFYGCSGFEKLVFAKNSALEEIGGSAFRDCSGFAGDLEIPDSVTTIDTSAFNGCYGFNGKLKMPNSDGFTEIKSSAFINCSGFKGELIIPANIKTIGQRAFEGCTGFEKLVFAENSALELIIDHAFLNCSGLTGDLEIPSAVKSIQHDAFNGCYGLNGTLTLPGSLTVIEDNAFKYCYSIKRVILGNNTAIAAAFEGCTSIFEVVNLVSGLTIQHGSDAYGGLAKYARSIVTSLADSTLVNDADGLWYGRSNHPDDTGKWYAVGHDSSSPVFPDAIQGDEEYRLIDHIRLTPPKGQELTCLYIPFHIEVGTEAFPSMSFYSKSGPSIPASEYPAVIPGSYFIADGDGRLVLNYALVSEGGEPTGTLTLRDWTGTEVDGPVALDVDVEWTVSGNTMTFSLGGVEMFTITAEPRLEFQSFLNHGRSLGDSGPAERMRISAVFGTPDAVMSVTAKMDADIDCARYTVNGVHGPEPWDGSAAHMLPGEEFAVYLHSTSVPYGTKVVVDDGGTRTVSFIGDRYVIPSIDRDHVLHVNIWDGTHTQYVTVTVAGSPGGTVSSEEDSLVLISGAIWQISGSNIAISDANVRYEVSASPARGFELTGFTADGKIMKKSGTFSDDTVLSALFEKPTPDYTDDSGWDDPVWREITRPQYDGGSEDSTIKLSVAIAAAAVAAAVLYAAFSIRKDRNRKTGGSIARRHQTSSTEAQVASSSDGCLQLLRVPANRTLHRVPDNRFGRQECDPEARYR